LNEDPRVEVVDQEILVDRLAVELMVEELDTLYPPYRLKEIRFLLGKTNNLLFLGLP
jgi:hypothetical protein